MNNMKNIYIIGDTIEEITTIERTYIKQKGIKVIHRELCADEYGDLCLFMIVTNNSFTNWLNYKQLGGQLVDPDINTNHLLN